VPPFYNKLFKTSMYEGVTMTIDDEEVRQGFKKYLKQALKACS